MARPNEESERLGDIAGVGRKEHALEGTVGVLEEIDEGQGRRGKLQRLDLGKVFHLTLREVILLAGLLGLGDGRGQGGRLDLLLGLLIAIVVLLQLLE